MTVRERLEELERATLAPFACLSVDSRGRDIPVEPCQVRTCFQRDVDRIVHCKAFRRLKHKTQVFLQPEGDHYRTRMTHTLEVMRIARTMARGLRLNEDLTEAVAMGHDLGHTPFGHAGERLLNQIMPGGFRHYEQSLRVVERLENGGEGLNLCWEVRNGILRHTVDPLAATLEGQLVRLADHIAYINHDIDDAIRASQGQASIRQSQAVGKAMLDLKKFMFDSVYTNPLAKGEEGKAQEMLRFLFRYYRERPEELPADFQTIRAGEGVVRAVCDYIAGMTDPFAVEQFKKLFIPTGWGVK